MLAQATAAIQAKKLLKANFGRAFQKIGPSPSSTSEIGAYSDTDSWGWTQDEATPPLDQCLVKLSRAPAFWAGSTNHEPNYSDLVKKIYGDFERFSNVAWVQIDADLPIAMCKREIAPIKGKTRPAGHAVAYMAPWGAEQAVSYSQTVAPTSSDLVDRLLSEILALRDGWDGPGAIAPSRVAKEAASIVIGQIAQYLDRAEIEVDPSVGDVGFHWFMDDNSRIVSVTVQQSGRVVVVSSSEDGGTRVVLDRARVERVGRAAVDAGLGKLHEPV